jgi:hypothetical protein
MEAGLEGSIKINGINDEHGCGILSRDSRINHSVCVY